MKHLTKCTVLLSLISLSLGICRKRNPNPCADFCKFTFCLTDGFDTPTIPSSRLLLRDPRVATYPFVCAADNSTKIGRIKRVGEAQVACANNRPRTFFPISKYAAGLVHPPFHRKQIRLRPVTFPVLEGKYGISRERSRGNQDVFLDDICVYIPLLRYELFIGERKNFIKRVTLLDCVAFRAVLGVLVIEFTWSAGNDFDLSVTEPNGNVINNSNDRSPTGGRLIKDNNIGKCGIAPVGREQVTYRTRARPLAGQYLVEVRHFESCGPEVEFALAIIANGVNTILERGTTNAGDNQVVLSKTFTFP